MLNDRDDKFEGHEESEYHFSDDDASYEVETEEPKAEPAAPKEPKKSVTERLAGSKRMLISGGIFLVLIFIVYRMVAPSSVTPNTNISPTAQVPAPAAVPVQAPVPAPTQAASTQPPAPTAATPSQPPLVAQTPGSTSETPGQVATTSQAPGTVTIPAVIPVQSNTPTVAQSQQVTPASLTTDTTLANIQAQNEKMISDLQSDYTQKINDYTSQNKALEQQVQALSSQVATLSSQMNQLVKTINQQQSEAASEAVPASVPTVTEGKGAYNVQAIIPGRAWLRSDSGETVTVAEGDVIKDLGRVTKIDPYDGVVEINVGNKTISLSYGTGA